MQPSMCKEGEQNPLNDKIWISLDHIVMHGTSIYFTGVIPQAEALLTISHTQMLF